MNIVTLESNALAGGFGSAILELIAQSGFEKRVLNLGYPDEFIPHGNTDRLLENLKLTPEGIAEKVQAFLA